MTFRDAWQRVISTHRPSSSSSNTSAFSSGISTPLNQNPVTAAVLSPIQPVTIPMATMLAMNEAQIASQSPASSSPTSQLSKTTTATSTRSRLRLGRTFPWGSSKSASSKKKSKNSSSDDEDDEWYGPKRMKYRGPVNQKHKELLESFEWKFGRNASLSGASWCSGVSPCASRSASLVPDEN
ncbi:hypothetical protein BP6252_02304 [Coleophoma cylindrospora]|uniref:Uncharacterized protein n=1 Tax=Coleophoma cylindrospora TaxID=1849047 RepID=A0A3D8SF23_9HELO|nr:hypothetical protein BP6252_02304 [Coleophoma cylindrospora]